MATGWIDGFGNAAFLLSGDLLLGDKQQDGKQGKVLPPKDKSITEKSGKWSPQPVFGTAGDDTLVGTGGDDILYGKDGNDVIDGLKGNDTIFGGEGDDTLMGGKGGDALFGGAGDDEISGGPGNDTIKGGPGNDTIAGDDGDDLICGNAGDDVLAGGAGNDTIFGGAGQDTISGGLGDDMLIGGADSDTIEGGAGNDIILGDGGDCGEGLVRVSFVSETADFRNTVGIYQVDPTTGVIVGVHLAFLDASEPPLTTGDSFDYLAGPGMGVGLFVIANGFNENDFGALGPGSYSFLDENGNLATIASTNPKLVHTAPDGTQTTIQGFIFHSAAFGANLALNPDGELHTKGFGQLADGSVKIGFEDLFGLGDADFDDPILQIDLGTSGATLLNAHYDYSSEAPDAPATPGNNLLIGDYGDDVVFGGAGNDTILGGTGNDLLYGKDGDDVIDGGEGDDTIFGGAGDDELRGGPGDDLIYGGAGNDTIFGGTGNNTLFGGDDRDTFVIEHITGDQVIFGGDGGDDFDTLDFSPIGRAGWRFVATRPDSDGNGIDGEIELLDGDGNVTGTIVFENIEKIIPCFTPGTLIATPRGERPVEDLRPGDKVITRDNGIQEIRWWGRKDLDAATLTLHPHLRPVLIRKGSLGNGLPERDMLVSPNHRVLVANDRTALYFDEHEVLVAAKHLVGAGGIAPVQAAGTVYIHFMCDRHEVVLSDGAWTETFQPGDYTLKGMGNAQRTEILELFPELATSAGREGYVAARKTLKRHEAALLHR